MGRKKATGKRAYVGLEPGLTEANAKNLTSSNKRNTHQTKTSVEQVVRKVIDSMKKQSRGFARLYSKNFGGGSIYDGLKIGMADEFDIDILLKIPELGKPVLVEDGVAGFAQLKLKNLHLLIKEDPDAHNFISQFVDEDNYILPRKMKSLMQSIFDKTILNYFPDGRVKIGRKNYKITKIQHLGPAFTLTLDGSNLEAVAVDLVPSILLDKNFWPVQNCRSNPYTKSNEFFLAPTGPKQDHAHKERFWRLSFHPQERVIIFNRFWMKPAIRVLKCMRDHFDHSIRSYAIKTVFLWEIYRENPALDQVTPVFWKNTLSYIVVNMLEKYLECLTERNIPDFWNHNLNLLCHLSDQQLDQYRNDVAAMLDNIKLNPTQQGNVPHFWNSGFNLLSYLSQEQLEQYVKDIEGMLNNIKRDPLPETLLEYLK